MKINWKRVVIGAIWSEFLLLAVIIVFRLGLIGALSAEFVLPFLAGLWVGRKIEAGFLFHGVLVGIFTNVLYTLMVLPQILNGQFNLTWSLFFGYVIKILGSGLGAYIVGNRRKKQLAAQAGKSTV